MNAAVEPHVLQAQRLAGQIATATARIAPTWPLDRFIAVNPYWGWLGRPIDEAAAGLGTLAGTRLTMPREWFLAQWQAGRLQRRHLHAAATQAFGLANAAADALAAELEASLQRSSPPITRLPLVTDLRDASAPPRPGLSWTELVTHQVSQHCAAFFDRQQARWGMDTSAGLYGSWRGQLAADHSLPWRQGRRALWQRLDALPAAPQALIAAALDGLGVPDDGREAYLSAVLMAIGGWAAWCAHERRQARLRGRSGDDSDDSDDPIEQLLAIRLAWEWLLLEDAEPGSLPAGWAARWSESTAAAHALQRAQRTDWLLQRAAEIAFQAPLIDALRRPLEPAAPPPPAVQAVFCIDVRSEVFRRALEATSPAVHTRGFAGFFGLPIAYAPLGSRLERPQLPGLLAPAHRVSELAGPDGRDLDANGTGLGQRLAAHRRQVLQWRQRWAEFRAAPSSGFSFVETMGLGYGAKLLADSLPRAAAPARWEDDGLPRAAAATLRPGLPQTRDDPAAAAALAHGILHAMGLRDGFAPLVLLAGHGSRTSNNPHAAGLDCGACGGQTGEVNARVLADLLNAPAVRKHLRGLGIDIPGGTHFLPGLHNTTTDEVRLFDTHAVPTALNDALTELRTWLAVAGRQARAERAEGLGLGQLAGDDDALEQAVQERANDWSQVRPEWGLADNAAFIVAPRSRTRGRNLAGRSFLHDYDHRLDADLRVLTLIMTAPMVVTNWINLQYHASTVDNRRYGSGNKLLHNVVGGHLGVFEGNGGDLRIGLPLQSLHDGQHLRHTPLRLSVFIEAPRAGIETVIAAQAVVRQLVEHGWLHLFRIDPDSGSVEQRMHGSWAAWADESGAGVAAQPS